MEYFDEVNGAKVRDKEARADIEALKNAGGGKLYFHEVRIEPTDTEVIGEINIPFFSRRSTKFTRLDDLLNEVNYLKAGYIPCVVLSGTGFLRSNVSIRFDYSELDDNPGVYSEIVLELQGVLATDGSTVDTLDTTLTFYPVDYEVTLLNYTPVEV